MYPIAGLAMPPPTKPSRPRRPLFDPSDGLPESRRVFLRRGGGQLAADAGNSARNKVKHQLVPFRPTPVPPAAGGRRLPPGASPGTQTQHTTLVVLYELVS